MKLIDGHDVIEHAEVNGENRDFIKKLTDYIEDAPVVEPKIDKDALIRLIQGAVEDGDDCRRLIEMVEPKWIPCSERLPEENGKSYLTYQCGDDIRYGWCQVLPYEDGWNCYGDYRDNEINSVVAWMPLPPAYEGE